MVEVVGAACHPWVGMVPDPTSTVRVLGRPQDPLVIKHHREGEEVDIELALMILIHRDHGQDHPVQGDVVEMIMKADDEVQAEAAMVAMATEVDLAAAGVETDKRGAGP